MTDASSDVADRLNYLKTCKEFIPSGSHARARDPDDAVYLELVEIASGESLGVVFPNGFMTAVKCLEAYAASPTRAVSVGLREQMRELASRLHDGRCGYRFFQDSQRYPEDADSTALLNAALLVNGDLPPRAQALAQVRILGSRVDNRSFSVWLLDGSARRAEVRDAVVDMNVFGALVLLSGGKAEFRNAFECAAAKAVVACEAGASVYYNNPQFVRHLHAVWYRLLVPVDCTAQPLLSMERFRGEILAQHRDGAVGYVMC